MQLSKNYKELSNVKYEDLLEDFLWEKFFYMKGNWNDFFENQKNLMTKHNKEI